MQISRQVNLFARSTTVSRQILGFFIFRFAGMNTLYHVVGTIWVSLQLTPGSRSRRG